MIEPQTEFRAVVRVYVRGRLRSIEKLCRPIADVDSVILKMAEKHAKQCLREPTMIEFEFLDEPDPQERMFRIGSDPRGMVRPRPIIAGPSARTVH